MSGHTPGQWSYTGTVAPAYFPLLGKELITISGGARHVAYAHDSNDAALIAAAPELLKALKECEAQLVDALAREGAKFPGHKNGRDGEAIRMARAAISKAEGERK